MTAAAKSEPRIALLQTIPGIGPITASAIVASVGSAEQFRSGRDLSAWLGLTPNNKSTGGKERLGRISKMGDRYIRRPMVVGMTSRIKQIKNAPERFDPWFADIPQRKPAKLAAIAMGQTRPQGSSGRCYRAMNPRRYEQSEPRRSEQRDSKTNEVMADKSAPTSRHPGLCPGR